MTLSQNNKHTFCNKFNKAHTFVVFIKQTERVHPFMAPQKSNSGCTTTGRGQSEMRGHEVAVV